MKIVHLQSVVTSSGNAPYRLHKFLLENGIDSKMIVQQKKLNDDTVSLYKNNDIERFLISNFRIFLENFIVNKILKMLKKITFSTWKIGVKISKHDWIKEADIIHLHWINGGFISLNEIKELLKLDKKIIWTFHDNAPFTGGCHVRSGCNEYMKNCEECPIVGSKIFKNYPKKVMEKKSLFFDNHKNLKIVTPSKWMMDNVNRGNIFKKNPKYIIPNVLDEKIFKKLDKKSCREILNLKQDKKYILFGAVSINDPNKGYKELLEALKILKGKNKYNNLEILIFGRNKIQDKLPFEYTELGEVNSEILLSIIYNAADIFIGPSHEESFGQVFNESIFCETPAIAFNGSGSSDIIEHLKNGFLAEPYSPKDLVVGIEFFLDNPKEVISVDRMRKKNIYEKLKKVYGLEI